MTRRALVHYVAKGVASTGAHDPSPAMRSSFCTPLTAPTRPPPSAPARSPKLAAAAAISCSMEQGLTLVNFSAQPKPLWSHLLVSPCLIDWGKIMHPTYPTKCAYV